MGNVLCALLTIGCPPPVPAPMPVPVPIPMPASAPVTTAAPVVLPTLPPLGNASFIIGINSHHQPYGLAAVQLLKPRIVRIGHLWAHMPRSEIQMHADNHAKYGAQIVPLVDFNAPPPPDKDVINVGTWATIPNVAAIEFGNEPWTQPNWNRTQYALAFKLAQDAVYAANPNMTLIAVADPGDAAEPRQGLLVMQEMQKIGVKPRAIQIHTYGPTAFMADKLARCKKDLAEMGWSDIPIWVTETGIANNGNTLMCCDNGPWPLRVPYDMATKVIEESVETLRLGGVSRVMLFKDIDVRAPRVPLLNPQMFYGLTNHVAEAKGTVTATAIELLAKYHS